MSVAARGLAYERLSGSKALVCTYDPPCRLSLTKSQAVTNDTPELSSVLIDRARSIAAEHGKLAAQLSSEYDATVAKKIGEFSNTVQTLNEWDKARKARAEYQCFGHKLMLNKISSL